MFDSWLEVAYKQTQTKTASRELIDRMKLLPLGELIKAAAGDPTSKLAYVDGPEDKQWIDKYKGTPLFEQAVALEKELLQIDMQENSEHAARKAESEPKTDFYDMRDALKLKQRMLDLELATTQEAAENPEASVAQEAPPIAQPPAQESAVPKTAGSAVGTFIPESRSTGKTPADDRAQGAGAGNYTPEPSETVTGNIQVDKTAAAADTLKRYGQLVTGSKAKELGQTAKGWTRAARLTEGRPSHDLVARAAERVGSMAKSERLKSLGAQGATAAGAGAAAAGAHHAVRSEKTAAGPTPYDELLQTELQQRHHDRKATSQEEHPVRTRVVNALGGGAKGAVRGLIGGGLASSLLTKNPRSIAVNSLLGAGLGGGIGAIGGALKKPGAEHRALSNEGMGILHPDALGQEVADSREVGDYINENPGKIRLARGALGAAAGGLGGAMLGSAIAGRPGMGALIGGAGLGALSMIPRPSGEEFHGDAAEIEKYMKSRGMQPGAEKQANVLTEEARSHISKKNFALPKANGGKGGYPIENKAHAENALSRVDTFGTPAEKSKVHSAVAKEYPGLAARSSVPDVAEKGHKALKKAASLTPAKRAEMPESDFAIPEKKKYLVNDARHAHLALKIVGRPGAPPDERAAVHKAIAEKHPGLVSKHLPPKTAGIGDIATAAKGVLGAGKNMAQTAYKSGGLGQVAKSFGGVAGGLAKAHPLATAGLAAGGGLLAGKMLSRPQQPKLAAVNLRGVAEGARQLPLG